MQKHIDMKCQDTLRECQKFGDSQLVFKPGCILEPAKAILKYTDAQDPP